MRTLVVFYSREGNTRKIGEEIAKRINSDVDEIVDGKVGKGPIGFLKAGMITFLNRTPEISHEKNPAEYDLVVIGTPVWMGVATPTVKGYLAGRNLKNVAFFCTCGTGQGKTFTQMEELSEKPLATLEVTQSDLAKNKFEEKLQKFCETIKKHAEGEPSP